MRIVCNDGRTTLVFERPSRVLRADRFEDVRAVIESADVAVRGGAYVAGYVTYEAGAAFVPKQREPMRGTLPFAEIGIYEAPTRAAAIDANELPHDGRFSIGPIVPRMSRSRYAASIAAILTRDRDGDVYQVNLAAPFTFAFAGDPRALFDELARDGVYPHAAFVESERHAIVSCSPELFVRFADGRLVTKPMKGTASDDDLAALSDAKNRAEHIMIVDLLRNDLHRISSDVAVDRLAEIERYPTYATMTSTIVATRRRQFTLAETFAAMFPCGSITGAPKVTAMHAIADLEGERGAFCGSIGFRAPDGSGSWNVAIRTATIDRETGRGTLHVGGGIVADSKPRSEWAEICVKRRFIDRIAPTFSLLETLRYDQEARYRNLEEHLKRLGESADALHFDFDRMRVNEALLRVREPDVLVRLQLDPNGTFAITTRPFVDEANAAIVWSTAVIDATDPLQQHKTTWRPHYDAALARARRYGAFDALLCTTNGYVADGARTNVFITRGPGGLLYTPPNRDGALPGVLRAQLLRSGRAVEARLKRSDVTNASEVFVGNSARGLMRATLHDTLGP